MKRIIILIIVFAASINIPAQSVAINNNAASPDPSAILDVSNSSKGLLIPRMSSTAITSIASPAKGLLVYDTVKNQLMVNMGTIAAPNWQTIVFKSGWSLTGNSAIDPATNFIGTIDNKPLKFKVNNIDAGSIDPNGNVFLGLGSSNPLVTGLGNTGIGQAALSGISTGESNTAIGAGSLSSNTTGNNNTASGAGSLTLNETGNGNTAHGYYSLIYNTTGNSNTATGSSSLENNETGSNNTGTGDSSLLNNTTGAGNTANGHLSLSNNITGSYNTAIGYGANVSTGELTNATAIGQGAIADASNKVMIGNTNVTLVQTSGAMQSKGLYVTTDATPKNNSALLEIKSTAKGVLFPRLDTAQINAIVQPANGLMVYCTTFNKPVYWDGGYWYFFDGTRMKPVTVGELYGGGVVFYVDGSGRHGLIVATTDIHDSNFTLWGGDGGNTINQATVGAGQGNTLAIILYSSSYPSAAKDCDDLVLNGYNDWFLPSKDEFLLIYLNRYLLFDHTDFSFAYYWTSTRVSPNSFLIWVQSIPHDDGGYPQQHTTDASTPMVRTRAIRAF